MHSRTIGISSPAGDLEWFNWWDFPESLLSLAHVLSRGSSWYFWNRDLSTTHNCGRLARNSMSFRYAGRVKARLGRCGWRIRPEDRGRRFVIFPRALETSWFNAESAKRGFVPMGPSDGSEVRLYFLPKTHKPLPLRGRLVEVCRGRYPRVPPLPKAPWSITRLSDGVRKFFPDDSPGPVKRFSGDISSMFPSIPTEELVLLLRQRGSPAAADLVARVLGEYRICFGSVSYGVPLGLPIGHPWSPMLADFYLSVKEIPFVESLPPEVRFGRYVDDTLFSAPVSIPSLSIRSAYESAVAPLIVEWDDSESVSPLKFLDTDFARKGHRIVTPKFTASTFRPSFHDNRHPPPGGCVPPSLIVSSILSKFLRLAQIYFPEGNKWQVAYGLCSGKNTFKGMKELFSYLKSMRLLCYIPAVSRICIRNFLDSSSELPRLRLFFCPFWFTRRGRDVLAQLRTSFRIRWDLHGIRRLQHLV